jgi:poly-gamma-glutamate capsule biosynthesis protein CapA/YwtB (metallophosphatase superfamily)
VNARLKKVPVLRCIHSNPAGKKKKKSAEKRQQAVSVAMEKNSSDVHETADARLARLLQEEEGWIKFTLQISFRVFMGSCG